MITKQNYSGCHRAIVLTAVLVCASGALSAAESATTPETPPKWDTTAAAAITLTRGNSETFMGTLSLDTKRKWEKDEILPYGRYLAKNLKLTAASTRRFLQESAWFS